MADRMFEERRRSLEKFPVDLFVEFDVGSGSVTMVRSYGVKSVTYSATGVITVVLSDLYKKLLNFSGGVKKTSGVPNAPFVFMSSAPDMTTSTFVFKTCAASGASGALVATAPASSNNYRFDFTLSNTTAV